MRISTGVDLSHGLQDFVVLAKRMDCARACLNGIVIDDDEAADGDFVVEIEEDVRGARKGVAVKAQHSDGLDLVQMREGVCEKALDKVD